MRAVRRADPPQPPQDVGDVGPEDAPVVVALVDDDVGRGSRGSRPTTGARAAASDGACRGWSAGSRRGPGPSRAARGCCRRRGSRSGCPDHSARAPARPARSAGPGRAPWSGRGRGPCCPAGRGDPVTRGSPSAPAIDRPATSRRRCRWRARRAPLRTPHLPRPPDDATAAPGPGPRRRPRRRDRPRRASPRSRTRAGAAPRGGSGGPRGPEPRSAGRPERSRARRRDALRLATRQSPKQHRHPEVSPAAVCNFRMRC